MPGAAPQHAHAFLPTLSRSLSPSLPAPRAQTCCWGGRTAACAGCLTSRSAWAGQTAPTPAPGCARCREGVAAAAAARRGWTWMRHLPARAGRHLGGRQMGSRKRREGTWMSMTLTVRRSRWAASLGPTNAGVPASVSGSGERDLQAAGPAMLMSSGQGWLALSSCLTA